MRAAVQPRAEESDVLPGRRRIAPIAGGLIAKMIRDRGVAIHHIAHALADLWQTPKLTRGRDGLLVSTKK
ncbi:hypothetical protein [Bradyrhizobium sp. Tv2a-2]|uniref:hypothetical protein n=1 Tax=Bradyrhizobium sp. Tv2a-2 TaxID=113395 RepID=UPI000462F005|nr:hypothetical protein [Bradyrhizobium sp. Tv2a-2]